MANSKLIWAILMLFVSVISTILIVFRLNYYIIELCVIAGMITIGAIGIAGGIMNKGWGKGLILVLFSIIILNLGYLYYIKNVRGNLYSLAIAAAVIGLVASFGISVKRRMKKPEPKVEIVAAAPEKKQRKKKAKKKA